MKRRTLLRSLPLAALGMAVNGRLYAGAPQGPKFLLVFLRGGYDCASALVPFSSPFYYESRPHIALAAAAGAGQGPAAGAGVPASARPLDGEWALAPALQPDFGPLWQARELVAIPFAGTEDLSRSHFETQDDIELGAQPGHRQYGSGFLARLATEVAGARPIAFTAGLPMAFGGLANVPSVAIRDAGRGVIEPAQADRFRELYRDHPLAGAINEGLNLRAEVAADLAAEMKAAGGKAPPAKGFANDAPRIATLLKDEFSIGFVDLGGWDTHVNQGAADGTLARNLNSLGAGLTALRGGLGSDWTRTVVVVVSEFGRTFRENGNRGTDHGHGSVYWVLGGAVHGGRVAGRQVAITPQTLFQDRDFPVLNNYRNVLGGLFARLYGLDGRALERVFPGARPESLDLV